MGPRKKTDLIPIYTDPGHPGGTPGGALGEPLDHLGRPVGAFTGTFVACLSGAAFRCDFGSRNHRKMTLADVPGGA